MLPERRDYTELHERIASLETLVIEQSKDTRELITYLRGNGQPGIINALDGRIESLETTRARLSGIAWLIGILGTVFSALVGLFWNHE